MSDTDAYKPHNASAPNAVHRLKDRARYDEDTVHAIVDAGAVAHVTFRVPPADPDAPPDPDDWPVIIPMIYARRDTTVYLHGHLSSRLLKALSEDDVRACVAITSVRGLVVSLTPFHNSNNYASAVLFGRTRLVADPEEKEAALQLVTNHQFGGADRWADSRTPSAEDVRTTRVVAFEVEMASGKVREGGPKDEKKDVEDPGVAGRFWSGHLVKEERWVRAVPSGYCTVEEPEYIKRMLAE